MELKINVTNQRLSFGENPPEIFSGDQSIDFVEFTFTDDTWNFPNIWAIFSRHKGASYQIALDDNKVMIPAEVMQKRGYVYIGLMATDGENVQTSSVLQYSIRQGAANVDTISPSPNIYEQFLADLDAYQEAIHNLETLAATAETLPAGSDATASYDNGVLQLGIPKGDTGATGNGIQSITKTGTSGSVDTYTITFTNGQTTTYTVTNGEVTQAELNSIIPFRYLNLFDTNTLTADYMITPSTGTMDPVAGWSASDYIEVEGMTSVMIMLRVYNQYSHYAFYDATKTYISGGSALSASGGTYCDVEVAVPLNAVYMRVCCLTTLVSGYMLVNSALYSANMAYVPFGTLGVDNDKIADQSIDSSKIRDVSINTTLSVGPGKDYEKFEDALAVANADPQHKYRIKVYEGTYNVFADVTPDASYIGYNAANLEIVGIGNKENIIIYGYFPDSVSSAIRDKVSVFNIKGNFKCENITISAKNIRYTIHDDYSVVSYCTVEYIDCILKGEAMTHNNTYGCGLWNGTTYKFTRCVFIGITSTFCWGFHTIANAAEAITPAKTIFDDCTFLTDNNYFSTFNSNHTKFRDSVTFNGCRFCGFIYPTGAQNMVDIFGSGNSDLEIRDNTTAKDCFAKFGDTTTQLANKNASTLTKGTVVMRKNWNGFDICGNGDLPLGILLEDTASGAFGTIQTKGVLPNTIIVCDTGQSISNNNGTLVIGTSNVIGKCIMTNLVKLLID